MPLEKDQLTKKTRTKIIELFGAKSALAQAMESEDFFEKLGDLIAWLIGELVLSGALSPSAPRQRDSLPSYKHPGIWKQEMKRSSSFPSPFMTRITKALSGDKEV